MNFLVLFLEFSFLYFGVNSISVDCEFRDDEWGGGKYGYECFVKSINITSKNDRTITEITGAHLEGRNNCNVVQFDSRVKSANYFPKDLEKFFPNIETIVIVTGAGLKEISKEDLKPFGTKLRALFIGQNPFDVVDFDLFRYNPNLELISFYESPIKHIDDGTFDNLPKLSTLIMTNVECAGNVASSGRLDTVKLIRYAERNCKDPTIEKEREQIQALKYEIEKTQGLLGFELENGIISVQKTAFDLFNRTSNSPAVDQCSEFQTTSDSIVKIREMSNQYTKLRENQIQIWTRAKNEMNLLVSKLNLFCPNSSQNCGAMFQELQILNRIVNSVQHLNASNGNLSRGYQRRFSSGNK